MSQLTPTNEDRAAIARECLEPYRAAWAPGEDEETCARDLVIDLLHLLRTHHPEEDDFDRMWANLRDNFDEEERDHQRALTE